LIFLRLPHEKRRGLAGRGSPAQGAKPARRLQGRHPRAALEDMETVLTRLERGASVWRPSTPDVYGVDHRVGGLSSDAVARLKTLDEGGEAARARRPPGSSPAPPRVTRSGRGLCGAVGEPADGVKRCEWAGPVLEQQFRSVGP
jgi:hypothetical protein